MSGAPPAAVTAGSFGTVALCRCLRTSARRRAGTSNSAMISAATRPNQKPFVDVGDEPVLDGPAAPGSFWPLFGRSPAADEADGSAPGSASLDGAGAVGVGASTSGAYGARAKPGTPVAGVASNGTQPTPAK